jgi:hypothetical protein
MAPTSDENQSRFVVLLHEFPPAHARARHWDLMLEEDGKLLTWALSESPQPGNSIPATPLPDHRIDYLQYEGPVSGNRGWVSRILSGVYWWESASRFEVAILDFQSFHWKIEFRTNRDSQLQIRVTEVA